MSPRHWSPKGAPTIPLSFGSRAEIATSPATYALVLVCDRRRRLRIGRLGEMQLWPGFYVYVGSAFGPGGLRARIGHHLRPAPRPHWHIDYLRACAEVQTICWRLDGRRQEHDWARRIGAMRTATAVPGFGSSDCACETHLFYFAACPSAAIKQALSASAIELTATSATPIEVPRFRLER